MTDGKKKNLSLTHPSRFWFYPSRFCLCSKAKKAFLRLKLASFAFEVSFISNWFEAQIKFTWGSIKVYVRFTSDSNEAQFDFFYVLLLKRKRIRIYTSYK